MPAAVPRAALEDWFCEPRCKLLSPRAPLPRVGAEYEMLVVDRATGREVPFDGPHGIEAVLGRLRDSDNGWNEVRDATAGNRLIGLDRKDGSTVTLEPGCQMELSTPPHDSVLEVDADLRAFVPTFYAATKGMDLALLAVGMNPFSATMEVKLGPKKRYQIMTEYLQKKGDLALDMMRRTLSVHCSFDYLDEADAIAKTRAGFAAAPVVTAIFAHSPLEKLQPNGFRSFRAEIWRHTDPDRCGTLPEVFRPDWNFSRYVDRVLELPLIFTIAKGEYRPVHGLPASRWFSGDWKDLDGHEGLAPKPDDLEWVINQSFRDARLRRYLECRAADFPSARMATSPVALWTGILYDADARAGAVDLVKHLDDAGRAALAAAVPREGLRAMAGTRPLADIARDLLALARRGLVRRGHGEERLLDPVDALVAEGRTPSDELLDRFAKTKRDAASLIDLLAF